jgi:sirohydrochlorin ferrochelatase
MEEGSTKNFMDGHDFGIAQNWSCFLVDNGSLSPVSVKQQRGMACSLGALLGVPVHPVGLKHSYRVSPSELDGFPGEGLEMALERFLGFPGRQDVVVVPQFFGPSLAVTKEIPGILEGFRGRTRGNGVRLAFGECLYRPDDGSARVLAGIIFWRVMEAVGKLKGAGLPRVALVDHGSAVEGVNDARRAVARELGAMLGGKAGAVVDCSMELPSGGSCDATLLADVLEQGHAGETVVVAKMFFASGRHACPGGDVDQICEAHSKGEWVCTEPIGNHPYLARLLAWRAMGATG